MPAKKSDFSQMAEIAKGEIDRDAPMFKTNLDLSSPDMSNVTDAEMVNIVRNNWSDPGFRNELVQKEAPDRVIDLLLKAHDVRDPQDPSKPMTVAQYKRQVLEPYLNTGTSPYINPIQGNPAPPAMAAAPIDHASLAGQAPPMLDPATGAAVPVQHVTQPTPLAAAPTAPPPAAAPNGGAVAAA